MKNVPRIYLEEYCKIYRTEAFIAEGKAVLEEIATAFDRLGRPNEANDVRIIALETEVRSLIGFAVLNDSYDFEVSALSRINGHRIIGQIDAIENHAARARHPSLARISLFSATIRQGFEDLARNKRQQNVSDLPLLDPAIYHAQS